MKKTSCTLLAVGLLAASISHAVVIQTSFVGDPGNQAQSPLNRIHNEIGNSNYGDGFGAVGYNYHIGTYAVTNAQYTVFLNAVAGVDPHGLYNTNMGSSVHGGISRSGSGTVSQFIYDPFTYSVRTATSGFNENQSMGQMPVNYVSFWDAARFANWLTTGDTETGVYVLDATGISNNTITRDATAWANGGVAIASESEWYKAAYYNPTSQTYSLYATGSDTAPVAAPSATLLISTAANAANYNNAVGTVTPVGDYTMATSAYGTFDQAGNVWEWNDEVLSWSRGVRGGSFSNFTNTLQSSSRGSSIPTFEDNFFGFRVSSLAPIPEPSAALLGGLGLLRRRRPVFAPSIRIKKSAMPLTANNSWQSGFGPSAIIVTKRQTKSISWWPRLFLSFTLILLITGTSAHAQELTLAELLEEVDRRVDPPALYHFYEKHVIHVKFRANRKVRLRHGQLQDLMGDKDGTVRRVKQRLNNWEVSGGHIRRAAGEVSEAAVDRLTEQVRAERRRNPRQPDAGDMNNVYAIHLPDTVSAADAIRHLRAEPAVEYAVFVPKPSPPPQSTHTAPDFTDPSVPIPEAITFGKQLYLGPAPTGVDAFYAWQGSSGTGAGVRICNIEYTCTPRHVDISHVVVAREPGPGLPLNGERFEDILFGHHGTAVLGVLGAKNDGRGVTGIAHGSSLRFVSEWGRGTFLWWDWGFSDRFGAILRAIEVTNPGDIIVLEMQTFGPYATASNTAYVPAEWDRMVYDAVVTANNSGRVVVAAAGNGAQNLDRPLFSSNVQGWPAGQGPFLPQYRSGSIIVGATFPQIFPEPDGTRREETEPAEFTTWGSRVDLNGWGMGVVTTGYGDIMPGTEPISLGFLNFLPNYQYTNRFGGTSSATPIVAGSAAVVQELYKKRFNRPATANEIRALLKSTGTPVGGTRNIGEQPNLREAIRSLASPGVLDPAAPVISLPGGVYYTPQTVNLGFGNPAQTTDNTEIRFTLDGTDPTFASQRFVPGQSPIQLLRTVELRTRAFRRDTVLLRWFEGPVAAANYTFDDRAGKPHATIFARNDPALGRTLEPGDAVAGPATIFLGSPTPGATFRYSLTGAFFPEGHPNASPVFPGTLELQPGSYSLFAQAYLPGREPSVLLSISFTVLGGLTGQSVGGGAAKLAAPVLTPATATFALSGTITIQTGNPKCKYHSPTTADRAGAGEPDADLHPGDALPNTRCRNSLLDQQLRQRCLAHLDVV